MNHPIYPDQWLNRSTATLLAVVFEASLPEPAQARLGDQRTLVTVAMEPNKAKRGYAL